MKKYLFLILALLSFSATAEQTNFSKSLPACDDSKVKNFLYNIFEKNYFPRHMDAESIKNKEWTYSLENVSVIGFNDFKKYQKCKAMFILSNKKDNGRIGFEIIYEMNEKGMMITHYPKRPDRTLYDLYKPENRK